MKVQFIYTFEKRQQIITEYNPILKAFIKSKDIFLSYAINPLTDKERQELIKISCCIVDKKTPNPPKWYMDINGKFWLDDLDKWRQENNVKGTVSEDYRKEFCSQSQFLTPLNKTK